MMELSASDMQRMMIVYGYAKRALNEWGERGYKGARQSIPVQQDDTDVAMRDLLMEYAGLLKMLGVMGPAPARQESDVILQVTHHGKLQPSDNPVLLDDMFIDDIEDESEE